MSSVVVSLVVQLDSKPATTNVDAHKFKNVFFIVPLLLFVYAGVYVFLFRTPEC